MSKKSSRKKSLYKALTWRVVATMITVLIVYGVTGDVNISMGAGMVDVLVKMVFYYVHERVWERVDVR